MNTNQNRNLSALALLLLAGAAAAQIGPAQPAVIDGAAAIAQAQRLGIPLRWDIPGDGIVVIHRFENGVPIYVGTDNANSADTISTDELYTGGRLGRDLTGQGVTMGIWEAGGAVRTTHREFGDRVTQVDAVATTTHATHVAGTMIARGIEGLAKGMAFRAGLRAYDSTGDIAEMRTEAGNGLRLSNHSYSDRCGWWPGLTAAGNPAWYWHGDFNVSGVEGFQFGFYNAQARNVDRAVRDNPRYLPFMSASNQRSVNYVNQAGPGNPPTPWFRRNPATGAWQVPPGGVARPPANNDYDSIPGSNVAKNAMCIGNINRIVGGYRYARNVVLDSDSGCGPTDDGRIKPDLVACGDDVLSCNNTANDAYTQLSGTSMSTPAACGSTGLLLQLWRQTHPTAMDPLASTWRALLIHTADEAGADPADPDGAIPGPDYRFGWGLMNTLEAARVVERDPRSGYYSMHESNLTFIVSEREWTVYTDAYDESFKVTIAWTDPAAEVPAAALNPAAAMLVNDLDLRVIDNETNQVYRPWVLDPARPGREARRGDNTRDNVEQVVVDIPNPHNHQSWTIRANHKRTLQNDAAQYFSLIVTGASLRVPCDADYDGDGFVTGLDFDAFVRDFEAGSIAADVNGDFFVSGEDFDYYVAAFETGCN